MCGARLAFLPTAHWGAEDKQRAGAERAGGAYLGSGQGGEVRGPTGRRRRPLRRVVPPVQARRAAVLAVVVDGDLHGVVVVVRLPVRSAVRHAAARARRRVLGAGAGTVAASENGDLGGEVGA
jgi:hypothetical protein